MRLGERLRRLDDRLLPRRAVQSPRPSGRWFAALLVSGVVGTAVGVVMAGRDRPPVLGFNCVAAEQPTVERVLGTRVDGSHASGGVGSQQATGTWTYPESPSYT